MDKSITIQEQTHQYIKKATYLSGVLCIIFFLLFWNISSAFWISIFRLASFIFFALTVLGYLNIMNGPMTITLTFSEKYLLISYQQENSVIREEQFDYDSINEVRSSHSKQNLIYQILQPKSATLKVNFTDTKRDLFLIEFGGRPLFFDQPVLAKIKKFLENNEIKFVT